MTEASLAITAESDVDAEERVSLALADTAELVAAEEDKDASWAGDDMRERETRETAARGKRRE